MKPLNVIVMQRDEAATEALVAALHDHFKSVALAHDLEELLRTIPKHHADVLVADLEAISLLEMDDLRRRFRGLEVVCTHRLADEYMWSAALAAGAADCCHPSDIRTIVHAANRTVVMARTTAA
jgi:DNA-binding NtrC family response regulator